MFYREDEEKNTPLLQAAQPRIVKDKHPLYTIHDRVKDATITYSPYIERDIALPRLKERVQDGTLIIHSRKLLNSEVALSGLSPLTFTEKFFQEVKFSDASKNFLFLLLGSDRVEVTGFMSLVKESNDCRRILAPEIANAFINGMLPILEDGQELLNAYKEASDIYYDTLTSLEKKCCIPGEYMEKARYRFSIEDLSQCLLNETNSTDSQLIVSNLTLLQSSLRNLENYCSQQTVYEYYLNTMKDSALIPGYCTAIVASKVLNISITVWEKKSSDNNQLQFVDAFDITNPTFTVHLLIPRSSSFHLYTLLKETKELNFSKELSLGFCNIPIVKQVNKWKDNLLHRAVRSIAADKLTYYLLHECGFNQNNAVNDVTCYGKTALTRLLLYFNERRAEIIAVTSAADYSQILLFCCEELIKAGADPSFSTKFANNALERAEVYKNEKKIPGIDLKQWIIERRKEYLQSQDANLQVPSTSATLDSFLDYTALQALGIVHDDTATWSPASSAGNPNSGFASPSTVPPRKNTASNNNNMAVVQSVVSGTVNNNSRSGSLPAARPMQNPISNNNNQNTAVTGLPVSRTNAPPNRALSPSSVPRTQGTLSTTTTTARLSVSNAGNTWTSVQNTLNNNNNSTTNNKTKNPPPTKTPAKRATNKAQKTNTPPSPAPTITTTTTSSTTTTNTSAANKSTAVKRTMQPPQSKTSRKKAMVENLSTSTAIFLPSSPSHSVPNTPIPPNSPQIQPGSSIHSRTSIPPSTPPQISPNTPMLPSTPIPPSTPLISPSTPMLSSTPQLPPSTPMLLSTPMAPSTPMMPGTPLMPSTPLIPSTPMTPNTAMLIDSTKSNADFSSFFSTGSDIDFTSAILPANTTTVAPFISATNQIFTAPATPALVPDDDTQSDANQTPLTSMRLTQG